MATFNVYQKKPNKKGEAPIYVSFYLNREKIEVPTKVSVPVQEFDKEKKRVRLSYPFAKDKNLIISNISASINDILVRYRLRNESLSADTFWMEYRNPTQFKNFFDFCSHHQKLKFQEITEGTQKKHKACLGNLRRFKEVIYFDELTPTFFRQFAIYLRKVRGNKEVTINKTLDIISVYLNEAVRVEILKKNPIHGAKKRGAIDTVADHLDEAELNLLIDLYKKRDLSDSEYHALEFFLFLCFSSLHIGDAKALQIEQIGEGEFWYMRAKMLNIRPRVVRIPISEPLKIIINKLKGDRKKGSLWIDVLSDQKINKHLKTVARLAGIDKRLCAKMGRHTFATIYLRRTKDLNALKDVMGHSNIKQTLVYAHVLDQDRKQGIKVFDEFNL